MSKYSSMTFFESYHEAIKRLPDDLRLKLYDAVLDYALNGIEPEFDDDPIAAGYFRLMRPNIDQSQSKREAGQNGGKAERKQNESRSEANTKQNGSKQEAEQKQNGSRSEADAKQPSSNREREREGEKEGDSDREHISAPARDSAPKKPTKHFYGSEFKRVLLTDEEFEKLMRDFPYDYMDRIDELDNYIASRGDKYKSHYATIRAWAKRKEDEAAAKAHEKREGINKRAAELKAQDDILEAWARGESNPDSRDFWEVTT